MAKIDPRARERREIEYWATNDIESPDADTLHNLVSKMTEAGVLLEKLDEFRDVFASSKIVVELGGGQCWGSCIVKRNHPGATVLGSDIAQAAVASTHRWERVFGVRLDGVAAHMSSALPYRDESVDLVYVFASAHHFGRHEETLAEIARVLRPGGKALYLHEPACRAWIHGMAYRRVNRKRPVVPEDVIVYPALRRFGARAGLETEILFNPSLKARAPKETVYYVVLQLVPFLKRVLPTSIDVVFTKPCAS